MSGVKEVVGISVGSSKRDHTVELDLLGQKFRIWREGMDGDYDRALARFIELDGKVAAFGLGGIDLKLRAAGRDYYFRDAKKFAQAIKRTPIVDGSGLKGAVEADVVRHMRDDLGIELAGKRVLMTSAIDRWGMTVALVEAGCDVACGDLLYALNIPVLVRSMRVFKMLMRTIAPIAAQLPFSWLYPSEADHTSEVEHKHERIYREADIIAGDYKYVHQFMPDDMSGKWVITNTTTAEDVEFMRERGVELLVTSTPRLEGRTFGTNIMEATLVAYRDAKGPLSAEEYMAILREVGFAPDVRWLQREQ